MEDEDWESYESGPFCRHYGDPSDCDERCAACGHHCARHDYESPGPCMECECKGWEETEEKEISR